MSQNNTRLTILHEVAHSLYAIQHGLMVIKIDVREDCSATSYIAYKYDDGTTVIPIDKVIIMLIAGCVAEMIAKHMPVYFFYREWNSSRYVSDRASIEELTKSSYVSEKNVEEAFHWVLENYGELCVISDSMLKDYERGKRSFQIEEYLMEYE